MRQSLDSRDKTCMRCKYIVCFDITTRRRRIFKKSCKTEVNTVVHHYPKWICIVIALTPSFGRSTLPVNVLTSLIR